MEKLKIEYVDINTIKPYKNNAKEHPQKQALQCYMYMNKDKDLMYIKKI